MLTTKGLRKAFGKLMRKSTYNLRNETPSQDTTTGENKTGTPIPCFGQRHVVVVLGFFLCALANSHRLVIGVTIVAMVNHTHIIKGHSNKSELSCPLREEYKNSSEPLLKGNLDWDSEMQGYILGAGYLGLIITQIPGGRMAESWGAKRLLFFGNTISALCSLVSPFAARWNVYLMIFVQFLRALAQGVILPSVYAMMANWFPKNERGYLSTFLLSGFPFGAVTAGLLSGWLCDLPGLGWPSAYYTYGIIGGVLSLIFILSYHDVPENNPRISQSELKYITERQENDMSEKRMTTPWFKMFTSLPVYAVFAGMYGFRWSTIYFLTVHPTYMGTVLHYSMTDNGIVSSLPILLKTLGGFTATIVTNILTNRLHANWIRKGCNSIGVFGFSIALFGVSLSGCNDTLNVVCFSLACFCTGFSISGAMIIALDMSPRFAGSLMGVTTALSDTASVIIHIMVGELTKNESLAEWQQVFYVSIAVVMTCGVLFIVFGSAEVQPWNYSEAELSEFSKLPERRNTISVENKGNIQDSYM